MAVRNFPQITYEPVRSGLAKRPGLMLPADKGKLDKLKVPTSRLAYTPVANLMNGTAIVSAVWTDLSANQSFFVGSATCWLEAEIHLILVATAAAAAQISARAVFNSAGTPIFVPVSGGIITPAGGWGTLLGRTFKVPPSLLPTGANTIKVQVLSTLNCTAYCRPASQPDYESFGLRVVELSA